MAAHTSETVSSICRYRRRYHRPFRHHPTHHSLPTNPPGPTTHTPTYTTHPRPPRPLIFTVASDETERLVSKNGLLFHELVSAFAHCQLKSSFRSINHNYTLNREWSPPRAAEFRGAPFVTPPLHRSTIPPLHAVSCRLAPLRAPNPSRPLPAFPRPTHKPSHSLRFSRT